MVLRLKKCSVSDIWTIEFSFKATSTDYNGLSATWPAGRVHLFVESYIMNKLKQLQINAPSFASKIPTMSLLKIISFLKRLT